MNSGRGLDEVKSTTNYEVIAADVAAEVDAQATLRIVNRASDLTWKKPLCLNFQESVDMYRAACRRKFDGDLRNSQSDLLRATSSVGSTTPDVVALISLRALAHCPDASIRKAGPSQNSFGSGTRR